MKLKLKYKSLSKYKIENDNNAEIVSSITRYRESYENVSEFEEANKYKTDCRKARSVCLQTAIENKSSFIVNSHLFVIRKVPITCEEFLYLISHHVSYENIRIIYLEDIPVSEEMFCLFFEMLSKYALYIEELTLIKLPSLSSQKITPILKNLVGNLLSLKVFCIN